MNKEFKNSEDFLTNKVGLTHGFVVSEDYFETIEDTVLAKLSEEKLTKKPGFKIPENYFDNLEDSILNKISSEEKIGKVISLRTKIARFASIAAAACILLLVGLQFFNNSEINSFDSLAIYDIENWVENNVAVIDSYDLTSEFKTSDFDGNELLSSEISDETIENYLTNVDTSTLLNEID